MRLFGFLVISAICALAACSLYEEGSSSITGNPPPDAESHNCGSDGGSDPLPDAGWIDDAGGYLPDAYIPDDGGGYLPDAYGPDAPTDAGHGHH